MKDFNVKNLSVIQFNGYFKDWLNSLVRKTFSGETDLYFITYQPHELTLLSNEVKAHTKALFGNVKYVEVIEQTFIENKVYNTGNYIDGYHSHLIVKESDYKKIAHTLTEFDIKAKWVYDLTGLKEYLSKQAGGTRNRILPTRNVPPPTIEIIVTNVKQATYKVINIVVVTVRFIPSSIFVAERLLPVNKINRKHMFIDDT